MLLSRTTTFNSALARFLDPRLLTACSGRPVRLHSARVCSPRHAGSEDQLSMHPIAPIGSDIFNSIDLTTRSPYNHPYPSNSHHAHLQTAGRQRSDRWPTARDTIHSAPYTVHCTATITQRSTQNNPIQPYAALHCTCNCTCTTHRSIKVGQ